jgi:hypothetical protein
VDAHYAVVTQSFCGSLISKLSKERGCVTEKGKVCGGEWQCGRCGSVLSTVRAIESRRVGERVGVVDSVLYFYLVTGVTHRTNTVFFSSLITSQRGLKGSFGDRGEVR